VGEATAGVADLSVRHHKAGFGFALDGVNDVGGTERDVEIGHIVLMEKSGLVGGDAYAENADVVIFEDEMMVGFFGNGDGGGRLGVRGKCEKQQRRAEERFHWGLPRIET
jgi:hypothetical protein